MDLLLDTHTFIWFDLTPDKLSPTVLEALLSESSQLYLSIASLWEMQIKLQLDKLSLEAGLVETVGKHQAQNGLRLLEIKPEHVFSLGDLPNHHRDPFDRMLIAQAKAEGYQLVTKDEHIHAYSADVELLW